MLLLLKERDYEVTPLFIDYGQLSKKIEWESSKRVCSYLGLEPHKIDISTFGNEIKSGITDSSLDVKEKAFLPNRNLLFLLLASSYAYQNQIYNVAIGLIANPIFNDQTKKFVSSAETCIRESLDVDIKIVAPLIDLDKKDIYNIALEKKLPLNLVYFCHTGSKVPCGKCLACREHVITRAMLGLPEVDKI
jgi:7-cyano-7-deazaguanine synthase